MNTVQARGFRELPAAGGVAFLRLFSGWCPSFLPVLRCRSVGPIPGTAPLRLCVMAPPGRERFRSGSGSVKKAEAHLLLRLSAGPGLSALDPVINIPVLYHRVSPVAGYDDMIENENSDPVQQPLKLNR